MPGFPSRTRPRKPSRITAPLKIRTISGLGRGKALSSTRTGREFPCGPAADAARPVLVVSDCPLQVWNVEIRPQGFGHEELRVRGLPEQEVARALLAGGADDQVRVGELGVVEAGAKGPLVHLLRTEAVGDEGPHRV